MTTQEAYNRLRDILLNNTQLAEADREAICMAINTLNRQTPIKPVCQMKFGKYGAVTGLCPTCSCVNVSNSPCCGDCGQALEWEE